MPAIMKDTLLQLIESCEIDAEVTALREQLMAYPKMLAELDRGEAKVQKEIDDAKAQFTAAQSRRRKAELEVKSLREKADKYRAQQNMVKTNKELEAVNEEIASVAAKIDDREFEGLEALEEEESAQARIESAESAAKEFRDEASVERDRIQGQITEKKDRLAEDERERTLRVGRLEEDVSDIYELLNDRFPGAGVASIDGENCSACKMRLVKQRIGDVKKMQDLVRCDDCSRILYDPSSLESASSTETP